MLLVVCLPPPPPFVFTFCIYIYEDIGTSSKQWDKNPTGEQDICRWNRVYENYIDTHVSFVGCLQHPATKQKGGQVFHHLMFSAVWYVAYFILFSPKPAAVVVVCLFYSLPRPPRRQLFRK